MKIDKRIDETEDVYPDIAKDVESWKAVAYWKK